jgi:hypothetical protein
MIVGHNQFPELVLKNDGHLVGKAGLEMGGDVHAGGCVLNVM